MAVGSIFKAETDAGSLLSSTARVEAPFVKVTIGGYTFGVYEGESNSTTSSGVYSRMSEKFPNYIKSLEVKKINGTVNQYTLVIVYPILPNSDPNFFEKIFSSISKNRTIYIEYGDHLLPNYIYKSEEAIITAVATDFNIKDNTLGYTISATSTATLTLSNCHNFPAFYGKPSDKIKEIVNNKALYHLTDVFTGMINTDLSEFIDSSDKAVKIPAVTNKSVLEYISILVEYMIPLGTDNNSLITDGVYTLTTFDDSTGKYGGSYFRVRRVNKSSKNDSNLSTYVVDIGYPTANIITGFSIKSSDNWSIYYDYNMEANPSNYKKTINNKGETINVYSPNIYGINYTLTDQDKTWWTKNTKFPIQAEITLKGLLKPAILMNNIRLNVWFYGHKHSSSGYYLITSQVDKIDSNGYFTTLGLLRVDSDEEMI